MSHPQERGSIFGDTWQGVPSPIVLHEHPYPTRFHGPIWNYPYASLPYRENPYAQPPYAGLDGCLSCSPASGYAEAGGGLGQVNQASTVASAVGIVVDGAVGALGGYLVAPKSSDATAWAIGGAAATILFGIFGLAGTLVVGMVERK